MTHGPPEGGAAYAAPYDSAAPGPGRELLRAALVLLAYSVTHVIVNGVVLDETVIAAQVITGGVTYPPGHPHAIYYPGIFSLPHYLSALAWLIHPSAEVISAIRNVLFLFLTTFATFVVTFALARRALWGYVAVALLLAEVSLRLDGLYPLWIFPFIYSNGQIGLQLAVLILGLVLLRMWRSSAFLLGLLPAIHASFALILWPWALLFLIARRLYRDPPVLRRILAWGGLGGAACAALYVLIRVTAQQPPPVAPYDTIVADGAAIRQNFQIWTDIHRQPFRLVGFPYLVNSVAFFVVAALLWTRARSSGQSAGREAPAGSAQATKSIEPWPAAWVAVLGVIVWGYVYGTRVWQALPAGLPESLARTMPARYSNISAVLVLSLTIGLLAAGIAALDTHRRRVALAALGTLLVGGALLTAPWFLASGRDLVERNLLVLLWSLAFAIEWTASNGRRRALVAGLLLVLTASLLPFWSSTRIAAYLAGAAVVFTLLLSRPIVELTAARFRIRIPRLSDAAFLLPGALLLGMASLPGHGADRGQSRRWDMMDDDARAIGSWLRANARPDEQVLLGFTPAELQVKTGQPVLFEIKSLYIMAYMPELAPVIGVMTRDLYGVDYEDPASAVEQCGGEFLSTNCKLWNAIWERRTAAEWRALGAKYHFRFVLADTGVQLDLPAVVTGTRWSLYAIS